MRWLSGHRLALHLVRLGQHLLHARDAVLDRLPRAAFLLDGESAERGRSRLSLCGGEQHVDLVRFAAEADELRREEVRMARVAGDRAAQDIRRLAVARHAAAGLVGERDHAVDIRIVVQRDCSKCSAIIRATVAEQFTLVRMPM